MSSSSQDFERSEIRAPDRILEIDLVGMAIRKPPSLLKLLIQAPS